MGKLVSPEELHQFLMSLPKEELEKESQNIKKHLSQIKVEKIPNIDFEELNLDLDQFAEEYGLNYSTNTKISLQNTIFKLTTSDLTFEIAFQDPIMIIEYRTRSQKGHFIINLYDSFNQNNMNIELMDFIKSKYFGVM